MREKQNESKIQGAPVKSNFNRTVYKKWDGFGWDSLYHVGFPDRELASEGLEGGGDKEGKERENDFFGFSTFVNRSRFKLRDVDSFADMKRLNQRKSSDFVKQTCMHFLFYCMLFAAYAYPFSF